MIEHKVLAEKYRPRDVAGCILPQGLKAKFQNYIDDKYIPNLLLIGSSGIAKSTIAKAMCEELEFEYIQINGSSDATMDMLRNDLTQFASTVSMNGERKYIIIDEADNMSNAMQLAFRDFTEEYASNCGFILTCNYPARILKEIRSRLGEIVFAFPNEEKEDIQQKFFKRIVNILKAENVDVTSGDLQGIKNLIQNTYPDFRKTFNELQQRIGKGKLQLSENDILSEKDMNILFKGLKDKDFTVVRTWIGEHNAIDMAVIFDRIYRSNKISAVSIPSVVIIMAKYQFQQAFVADRELNLAAACVEIMNSAKWE